MLPTFAIWVFFQFVHAEPVSNLESFRSKNIISEKVLRWDWENWSEINIDKTGTPALHLTGAIHSDYAFTLDSKPVVPNTDGTFDVQLRLPKGSSEIFVVLQETEAEPTVSAFKVEWLQTCPAFGAKFRDHRGKETQTYLTGKFPTASCLQLDWTRQSEVQAHPTGWRHFGAGALLVFADGNRNSYSPYVSWKPARFFGNAWGLEGDIAATIIRYDSSNLRWAFLYGVNLFARAGQWEFAIGSGLQTWVDSEGTYPQLATEIRYRLPHRVLLPGEKITVAYHVFFSASAIHEICLGFAFDL